MARMGNYCKAYCLGKLHTFEGWSEKAKNAPCETWERDGKKEEVQRSLSPDSIVYLHENYVVTDDIFIDENIIFDQVTHEWINFCHNRLNFEIPDYVTASDRA